MVPRHDRWLGGEAGWAAEPEIRECGFRHGQNYQETKMYRYDEFDHRFVDERVAEFRDQVERRLTGALGRER